MTEDELFPERTSLRARLHADIIDAMRRYGSDATAVGQTFAAQQGVGRVDLQALVAVMSAEGAGEPLTPTALRRHLGLSSAGTSYVLDRLEAAGHVHRVREDTDHRKVRIRYTHHGMTTALAFFGPLGDRTNALMDTFTTDELAVVERFMTGAAVTIHAHRTQLDQEGRQRPDP